MLETLHILAVSYIKGMFDYVWDNGGVQCGHLTHLQSPCKGTLCKIIDGSSFCADHSYFSQLMQ